jgi:hypothetical protein
MSAALIDLVSKGAQDVYITGQPQVSFFRQNYKRYTNFSMRPERVDYIGTFGASNEVVVPLRSKGDLLSYIWIEAEGIASPGGNNAMFDTTASQPTTFQLWVGGQKVCELDSLFVQGVHNVLYNDSSAKSAMSYTTQTVQDNSKGNHYVIPFFFSEDWTKALPLVALQYHEVELRIKIQDQFSAVGTPKIYANYIYLDTDERKFFTDNEHELLITQTQYQPGSQADTEFDLTYFNHPVKAIHLVAGDIYNGNWDQHYTFNTGSLYINGTSLFENMSNIYHHDVVPQMHCTSIGNSTLDRDTVYTWPFCLNLAKSQPSGSLNFSRIDNAKLLLNSVTSASSPASSASARIYAVNYNILRIKSGMAGVAFGN